MQANIQHSLYGKMLQAVAVFMMDYNILDMLVLFAAFHFHMVRALKVGIIRQVCD